jgi:hypothetical protein
MKRCKVCNKALNNIMLQTLHTCRCKGLYCREHIINHNCNFDYNKLYLEKTKDELVVIESDKITKI